MRDRLKFFLIGCTTAAIIVAARTLFGYPLKQHKLWISAIIVAAGLGAAWKGTKDSQP